MPLGFWKPNLTWLKRLKTRLTSRPFRDALTELTVTLIAATLPIWFFPLIALFLIGFSYSWSLLDHSISEGELFLFCTSLVGPLLYILFRIYEVPESERPKRFKYKVSLVFPHALKFAVVILVICITSAAIFGLQKINPNFSGVDISKSGYIALSIGLFVISILAMLAATFFRNEMDIYSPSKLMRQEEDDFAKKYRSEESQS